MHCQEMAKDLESEDPKWLPLLLVQVSIDKSCGFPWSWEEGFKFWEEIMCKGYRGQMAFQGHSEIQDH